jgi:hypothetical protein
MRKEDVLKDSDDACDYEVAGSSANIAGNKNTLTAKTVFLQDSGDGEKELKAAHGTSYE